MRSLEEAEAFRAELAVAERAGAIALETDRTARAPRDLTAIRIADLDRLAAVLGAVTRASQLAHAREILAPYTASQPVVQAILETWATGRPVRREHPDQATVAALADAARVLAIRTEANDEVLLRRESIRLFRDSKRIEAIGRWLVLLHAGELAPVDYCEDDAFAALGLIREPQPFLVSGHGSARVRDTFLPLPRPYLGLPLNDVTEFVFESPPACVLSVENKQTFHELALRTQDTGPLLLYTGGMPGPAWLSLYRRLLATVPATARVLHFGDIDVGGFRIAATLATAARACDHTLQPWRMDPETLRREGHSLRAPTVSQSTAMQRWARAAGWQELAESISRAPGLLEQEALPPALPPH